MARHAKYTFPLTDGRTVGAGFKARGGYLRVQFPHPSVQGKYAETSTGVPVPKGWTPDKAPPPDAFTEASRVINACYAPSLPAAPQAVTWEHVITHLQGTPDLRPDSVRAYLTALRSVRLVLPATRGPNDITPSLALRWKREYLEGFFVRGKAADAKRYSRSPTSCGSYLRSLRSLWKKHLRPAGIVSANPWAEVTYPNVTKKKRVRLPQESAVQDLLNWLDNRHPGWKLPRLFVEVKMVAGCRTIDLCRTKSAALTGDVLTLTAEVTKTREARAVPLPPMLAAKLRQHAGPVWLWEQSVVESQTFRPTRRTQHTSSFDPSTWRWTIQNLFREFNEGRTPRDRVRPHDLRARAITLVAAATQSVDATAEALGVDAQTARHYLDSSAAFQGEKLLRGLASVLLPTSSDR